MKVYTILQGKYELEREIGTFSNKEDAEWIANENNKPPLDEMHTCYVSESEVQDKRLSSLWFIGTLEGLRIQPQNEEYKWIFENDTVTFYESSDLSFRCQSKTKEEAAEKLKEAIRNRPIEFPKNDCVVRKNCGRDLLTEEEIKLYLNNIYSFYD